MKKLGKWFVGLKITCYHCGQQYELTADDEPVTLGNDKYMVTCTEWDCSESIEFFKPYEAYRPRTIC
jgi:hypothetical protein